MDLTASTEPRSDQQNFDDYVTGDRTVTITGVTTGSAEQPVDIHIAEYPDRPYKPSKSMRRVLVAAWGPEASTYIGRRITLYGDPSVKFGGIALGGIKISHLSNLDKRLSVMLTASKGVRKPHTVEPLTAEPAKPSEPTSEQVAACNELTKLRAWWSTASGVGKKQIEARVAELTEESSESSAQGETFQDDHAGDIAAMNAENEAN